MARDVFRCAVVVCGVNGVALNAYAGDEGGWSQSSLVVWGSGTPIPPGSGAVSAFAGGYDHAVAKLQSGSVVCWGGNALGQSTVPANLGTVIAVGAGYYYTAALTADGSVHCWGYDDFGQCTVPSGLGVVTAIAAGRFHMAAIKQDGSVACWGYNSSGQCNPPGSLGTVTAIAAGQLNTGALQQDGTIACWGDNSYGQCVVPKQLTTATAIAAGSLCFAAIQPNGTLVCWGDNSYGQCDVPASIGVVTQVAAGDGGHTVALRQDGTVVAWGNNLYGQCDVPGGLGIVSDIAAGTHQTLALVGAAGLSPVRAVAPNGMDYEVFPNINAALVTPSDWLIEATAVPDPGFSASYSRSIRGIGDLVIAGNVLLSGSTMLAEGTLSISGTAVTVPSSSGEASVLASNFSSAVVPGITIGSLYTAGLRTQAPSSTLIRQSIGSYSGLANPAVSCTNRLILEGGTTAASSAFEACTDPQFATITPCVEFGPSSVVELPINGRLYTRGPTTTLMAGSVTLEDGSRIDTGADLAIGGVARVPSGSTVVLALDRVHSASPSLTVLEGAELLIENNSSVQSTAPALTKLSGDLAVGQDGLFSLVGGVDQLVIESRGEARCVGGAIRADEILLVGGPIGSADVGARLLGIDALIDVDTLRVQGGTASLAESSIIGDVILEARAGGSATNSVVALSGRVLGNINNEVGRLTSIGDLVIVGDVQNGAYGIIIARQGVVYVTGDLVNDGFIFGQIITDPQFAGGGGTQVGDGLQVAGSLSLTANGSVSFTEDLWRISICGDAAFACSSDSMRFDNASIFLEGCQGTQQSLEVTSADIGCTAAAFSGEEVGITLLGELELGVYTTVSLTNAFDNTIASASEAVYAKTLRVPAGAHLITNGIKVYTTNAIIEGTVDDLANICEIPVLPDADLNNDGFVNGIDLAYVLTYWGTNTAIADLDGDGLVGASDLAGILSAWTN